MNNFARPAPLVSEPFEPGVPDAGRAPHYVSVVVPLYNEEENLAPLIEALLPVLDTLGRDCELLIVNDGSTDRTDRWRPSCQSGTSASASSICAATPARPRR